MIDPRYSDIGRRVSFDPSDGSPRQSGIVTSFNDAFVFVHFDQERKAETTSMIRELLDWADVSTDAILEADEIRNRDVRWAKEDVQRSTETYFDVLQRTGVNLSVDPYDPYFTPHNVMHEDDDVAVDQASG